MAFQPVTWNNNELIEAEKLNRMAANDDWLNDHIALFSITSSDGTYSSGQLFLQAGYHDLFSGDYTADIDGGRIVTADIVFPTPFRYRPIVATSYVSHDINYREVAIMIGAKGGGKQPEKDGFRAHIIHNKGSAPFPVQTGKFFIHYIAIGVKV